MPTRHTLCYNLDAIAPTRGSGPQKYYPKWPTSVFLMYFGQTTVASPVCCCVWMRCWGVFPHKDPLSNDLKSRDNVYINTAIELWDSGSVGSFGVCVSVCVCMCYAESQLSARNKYTHTFSENHLYSYTINTYHTRTRREQPTAERKDS